MEVAIRLNIDPRKADQALRGLAVLPHGIGKTMRIAVFATGPAADAALKVATCLPGASRLRLGGHARGCRKTGFLPVK